MECDSSLPPGEIDKMKKSSYCKYLLRGILRGDTLAMFIYLFPISTNKKGKKRLKGNIDDPLTPRLTDYGALAITSCHLFSKAVLVTFVFAKGEP